MPRSHEVYMDGGVLVGYTDESGVWEGNPPVLVRALTEVEAARLAAHEAELAERAVLDAHYTALTEARELLLAYGTPQGLSFVETYSAVQTAVLDYRDAGVRDEACEQHLQWITTRVGEITASALYSLGALL